jgi:hypothetical protein
MTNVVTDESGGNVVAQCDCLRRSFPGLDFANPDLLRGIESGTIALPADTKRWAAIPNYGMHPELFGATYSETVLALLNHVDCYDPRAIGYALQPDVAQYLLRQREQTERFFHKLSEEQGNPDILIFATGSYTRHHDYPRCDARATFSSNKTCLGVFATGVILLLTRIIQTNNNDEFVCLGDEGAPVIDFGFAAARTLARSGRRIGASHPFFTPPFTSLLRFSFAGGKPTLMTLNLNCVPMDLVVPFGVAP